VLAFIEATASHHKAHPLNNLPFRLFLALACLVTTALPPSAAAQEKSVREKPIKTGDDAPNFTLKTVDDRAVELHKLTSKGPVVLMVLRGWPGYQCPLCTRQVGEFLGKSKDFAKQGARVVMVYPGPGEKLQAHAKEFMKEMKLPDAFEFVIDPDYTFTNAYGLRWDAKGETAYPSTFVIGKDNKISFAVVSMSHGGRSNAGKVLEELNKLK
jgi:peroxiredoxin